MNPAPWEYENVEQKHDRSAYGVVKDANGKILFDTLNSDVACIHEEYDEASVYRWDSAAEEHLTLAAAAPELRAACEAALAYDAAIQKRVVDGAVQIMETGGGVACGDDLDALYETWIKLARSAVAKAQRKS